VREGTPALVTLDVREALRRGEEPLGRILEAVANLPPGHGLRLLATFEPLPLYRVLAHKGFDHEARRRGPEDWEVIFRPRGAADPMAAPPPGGTAALSDDAWPPPVTHLDNRGLLPPQPMMRILETLEGLRPGEVLAAINDREPMFLFPELEARGHAIRVDRRSDGVYLTIRRGEDRG
jgi:uncharacterized protein (DUF2249 family)